MKRHRSDDDAMDDEGGVSLNIGTVSTLSGDEAKSRLAGHLIIPDVTERRGWREWYVYHDPPADPRLPIGFRRP